MKKLMIALCATLSLAFLSGCIQIYSDTVIEKDGSGKATLKMSVSKVIAESLEDMKAAGMDEDGKLGMLNFSHIDEKELMEKAMQYDVKIEKLEHGTIDGKPTLEVVMEFKNLKGMYYIIGNLVGEGYISLGIYDAGEGNFKLLPTEYEFSEEEAEEPAEKETPPTTMEEVAPELLQKLVDGLAEMDVTMKITVPGDIIQSNAPSTEGRTSNWTINSSSMTNAGQDMEPMIIFSGKGLNIMPLTELHTTEVNPETEPQVYDPERARWEQISKGMTESEVRGILGRPSKTMWMQTSMSGEGVEYWYYGDDWIVFDKSSHSAKGSVKSVFGFSVDIIK